DRIFQPGGFDTGVLLRDGHDVGWHLAHDGDALPRPGRVYRLDILAGFHPGPRHRSARGPFRHLRDHYGDRDLADRGVVHDVVAVLVDGRRPGEVLLAVKHDVPYGQGLPGEGDLPLHGRAGLVIGPAADREGQEAHQHKPAAGAGGMAKEHWPTPSMARDGEMYTTRP